MEKDVEQPPPGLEERRRLRLSGKTTAFGLVLAFLTTGILIPSMMRLAIWIELEIVLAAWWGIWLAVLSAMLYHGQRVADDHQLPSPRSWLNWGGKKEPETQSIKKSSSSSGWSGWYLDFSGADGEGCMWVLVAIVVAIALFFALWFLIEVAIPLVLFVLYLGARGMLSHVVNDRYRCKGRLGRALSWAFVWATVYTGPLAGVVWFVHFLLARASVGAVP
jgi:hypothetical protein